MAEHYKNLDENAAAGMKTSLESTRGVEEAWKAIRSDEDATDFAAFVLEKKIYVLSHKGARLRS